MGKYMRKTKITDTVAVMEVVSQSSVGVRTRARTLALQKLQSQPPSAESSYLQLRSRRLEKVAPAITDPKKLQRLQDNVRVQNPNPKPSSRGEGMIRNFAAVGGKEDEAEDCNSLNLSIEVEASFGENNMELDCRGRSTRESTPCSLLREPATAGTPGSTTRQTNGGRRVENSTRRRRNIPTSLEMEEFFASAEHHYQTLFTQKYNFDVVNDLPLPGRYEWVRVNY